MLTIYFVFSTGIFVSIHHCCNHCNEKTEITTCLCQDHDHDSHPHHVKDKHHHCHDTQYFFKILDNYEREEHTVSIDAETLPVQLVLYDTHDYLVTLYQVFFKTTEIQPPHPVIQGRLFADYTQQRLHYA